MKPDFYVGPFFWGPFLKLAKVLVLLVVFAGLLVETGCSSRSALVKKDHEDRFAAATAVPKQAARSASAAVKRIISPGKSNNPAPAIASYPAIPIYEDGARVRRFIREYAYQDRPTIKKYLGRAEEHLPMVKAVAKEHGLPEDVAYLFVLESGADREARSPANAVGMWQFMPATARSYGLRVDSWVDERLDPEKSTKAAMLYLKDLYGMFGCWRLALSAYNSGENKLNKVLCKEDADEYEEICSSRHLRRETREFWPRFQAIAQIAKSPEKYGFSVMNERAYQPDYEVVTVERSYSLATLASIVGMPVEKLESINPALLRGMTPAEGPQYSLKVPLGSKAMLVTNLKSAPTDLPQGGHVVHVVKKRDNLKQILGRYKVTKTELVSFNPDVNFHRRLRLGDRIVVPVKAKASKKASASTKQVSLLK